MFNPLDLGDLRILVTGASSGVGREVAVLFSRLHARLVITGRNAERLEATRARLEGNGHQAEPFDLGAVEEIPGWMKRMAAEGGAFDGLVHSAGLQALIPIRALSAARLDQLMRVNLTAALMLAKGFRQQRRQEAGGSIVFLSSIMGLVGEPGRTAYSASKAALIGATRSLALELAGERTRSGEHGDDGAIMGRFHA